LQLNKTSFGSSTTVGRHCASVRRTGAKRTLRLATYVIATALFSMIAFAQEEQIKNEVSVQALGSFAEQTTRNGVQELGTDSSGVLATYRYYFNRHNGIEANYAWSPNTQTYNTQSVDNNFHEASAAYVFRVPLKHWSPFVLGGVGALVFDPTNFSGASTQTRSAFLYGAGADLDLGHRFFLRAEYRGFIYDSPTYNLAALNGLGQVMHRAEPSFGFGWKF
jgi:outer membrane immunogenic protein